MEVCHVTWHNVIIKLNRARDHESRRHRDEKGRKLKAVSLYVRKHLLKLLTELQSSQQYPVLVHSND